MGDSNVTLMDVNTENDSIIKAYCDWIGPFVEEYGIDGLRIDAAWQVHADFWQPFAEAAGVFCIGEVFGNDPATASKWKGPLDSILNFPLRKGILDAFTIPGPQTSPPSKQQRRLIGIDSKMLDYWDTSWRTRVPRVGPTCQLTPKVLVRLVPSFYYRRYFKLTII